MHRYAILSILVLAVAAPLHAQSPRDSALVNILEEAAGRRWYLQVGTATDSIEGRIRAVDFETVELEHGSVALADVTTVRHRVKSGGGTLTGALIGGVIVTLALLPVAGLCESDCDWVVPGLVAIGGAVGGVIGGIVGSLVSPAETKWEILWIE